MSAAILKTIATLEMQLNELKSSIAGGAPMTPVKTKKEKDPDAPKKPANVWIIFTQRVGNLLKEAASADVARAEHFKGPATMVKEFCSMLKGQKPYEAWADSEVLEAFESWERPVHAKKSASTTPAESATSSDTGSVAGEKKERKKPAEKTPEEKAAINAKRAATVAAKKIAEAAPAVEPVAPAPATHAPKSKTFKKAAPSFTMEQLADFSAMTIDGVELGVNPRGDVIDDEMEFIGHYNAETKTFDRNATKPADWSAISQQLV
jgi:hypothetical protein